jgi:hypothetical protein
MDRLGLQPDDARQLPMGKSFAVIWGELERISPRLARRSLTPRDLPGQIHTAKVMLQRLRRAPEWVPRGQGGIQPLLTNNSYKRTGARHEFRDCVVSAERVVGLAQPMHKQDMRGILQ